jgi:hypothetical protein
MAEREKRYFDLSLDSLRAIGGWAAAWAERVLPIWEAYAPADGRPRAAIEGIRRFAAGGKRAAELRTLALAALAAARTATDPAAAAAASAAGMAASSAYTHPLADVQQTKHIVGPAAYAARAIELAAAGDEAAGDEAVRRAVADAPEAARAVLARMPARVAGKPRFDRLLYGLDAGLRGRTQGEADEDQG